MGNSRSCHNCKHKGDGYNQGHCKECFSIDNYPNYELKEYKIGENNG